MGSKDQDAMDGAIKEGGEEIKTVRTSEMSGSFRVWGAVLTERRCDPGRVQFLKVGVLGKESGLVL